MYFRILNALAVTLVTWTRLPRITWHLSHRRLTRMARDWTWSSPFDDRDMQGPGEVKASVRIGRTPVLASMTSLSIQCIYTQTSFRLRLDLCPLSLVQNLSIVLSTKQVHPAFCTSRNTYMILASSQIGRRHQPLDNQPR